MLLASRGVCRVLSQSILDEQCMLQHGMHESARKGTCDACQLSDSLVSEWRVVYTGHLLMLLPLVYYQAR